MSVLSGKWWIGCGLVVLAATVPATAHEELTQAKIEQFSEEGSLEGRRDRIATLNQFRMTEGSRQRAIYRIRRAELEAAGLSPVEAARALTGGPAMAFPFTASPELPAAGSVRTLTILIDFEGTRAESELPGLTTETLRDNIYGDGTEAAQEFMPHESLHGYYERASQGLVDLQGTVLDWYSFSKKRSTYEPEKASPLLSPALRRQVQAQNDNRAIFKMVEEVLDSVDATHDFSQYDNDNDGDIDLITVLYAGPRTGWGSFWWAYRWEFFVSEATKKFDGKRLKQFVFQFVETRGDNDTDYDPTTLMHEMGHAFGLADYYDYDATLGPPGGVGGLDMMHANQGNHNALSRWLLDWIRPSVMGSGAPTQRTLVASGSTATEHKAIAIFPQLATTDAPGGELFLIENRQPIGNDALLPGDGLLIWHADATVDASGDDFKYDNSFTDRKLIKLLRADSAADFGPSESANANTYFTSGDSLTPTSSPSSNNHGGQATGITVDQISAAGETMSLRIGFVSDAEDAAAEPDGGAEGAAPAALPAVAPSAPPESKVTVASLLTGQDPLTLDDLEALDRQFSVATAETLAAQWQAHRDSDAGRADNRSVVLKLLAARWASKSGVEAAAAVMALPTDDRLRKDALPLTLDAWVNADPVDAALWYLADPQVELRSEDWQSRFTDFTQDAFRGLYAHDWRQAVEGIDRLSSVEDVLKAVDGVFDSGRRMAESPEILSERLFTIESDVGKARAEMLLNLELLELKIQDPVERKQFRELTLERHPER